MALADEVNKLLEKGRDMVQKAIQKQVAEAAEVVAQSWQRALNELIEDDGLRNAIAERAASYMIETAFQKIAEAKEKAELSKFIENLFKSS